jgi:hypothetical protein
LALNIDDILAEVASVERSLSPPLDAPDDPIIYEDLPADPNIFPAFINVPRNTDILGRENGQRYMQHNIDILLLFSRGAAKYITHAQRQWIPIVLNGFDRNLTLNGSCDLAQITDANYDPVIIGSVPCIAITFRLTVSVTEIVEYCGGY